METHRDRLEEILSRLDARVDTEKVYTKLYRQTARQQADACDARRRAGQTLGALDGTIVSVKDLFDIAGEPTTAGSRIRRAAAPATRDAEVVQRLRKAGVILLGKTTMTEFAFTSVGLNDYFGTPGNATDPDRIPGGSSSGAAVSVAEGTSDVSIGTDTGGSVRIPAALNGIVGFKPTARRIPRAGAFPLSDTLDSIGPLARSVAACAHVDAIMSGDEPAACDPLPLNDLRIGVPTGAVMEDLDTEVAVAFSLALSKIERAGARLANLFVDDLLGEMEDATRAVSLGSMEGAKIHADWLRTEAAKSVDQRITVPLLKASGVDAVTYERTLQTRNTLVARMDDRLCGSDFVVLPTTPICAPRFAATAADGHERIEAQLLRNTRIANQFDLCAISLPLRGTRLPVGLMVVARANHDKALLRVARALELLLAASSDQTAPDLKVQ